MCNIATSFGKTRFFLLFHKPQKRVLSGGKGLIGAGVGPKVGTRYVVFSSQQTVFHVEMIHGNEPLHLLWTSNSLITHLTLGPIELSHCLVIRNRGYTCHHMTTRKVRLEDYLVTDSIIIHL
jgi:hypothetical protein